MISRLQMDIKYPIHAGDGSMVCGYVYKMQNIAIA